MVYTFLMIPRQIDSPRSSGSQAEPRGGAVGPAAMRQDDAGAAVRADPTRSTISISEDPRSLARLAEPDLALRPLKGIVVIDEVQRRPDLFPLLRVLADRRPLPARFLVLGSASPELLRQSSETLAGRSGNDSPWKASGWPIWARRPRAGIGSAADFPSPTPLAAKPIRSPGGGISSRHFSSATFRNWASPFRPRPCAASGTCWLIITGRFGTPPNSPARWPSTKPPCAIISI